MKTWYSIFSVSILLLLGGCRKANCPGPVELADQEYPTINEPSVETSLINGWQLKTSSLSGNLFTTEFLTKDVGYISGMGGVVYKTIDGGDSYQSLSVFSAPTNDSYTMDFIDQNTGYIGATGSNTSGIIRKTTDGGQNWQDVTVSPTIWRLIQFIDNNLGFVGGGVVGDAMASGRLFRTIDGGNNWTEIFISNLKTPRCITFVDNTTGFMSTSGGHVYKTTDAGLTWTHLNHNLATIIPEIQLITGVLYFKNSNEGFSFTNTAFFNDNFLMRTTDGGITWNEISIPSSGLATHNNYDDMHFTSNNIGYLSGGNATDVVPSLLVTTDGGTTWAPTALPSGIQRIHWMSFPEPNISYIVGGGGVVIKGTVQ